MAENAPQPSSNTAGGRTAVMPFLGELGSPHEIGLSTVPSLPRGDWDPVGREMPTTVSSTEVEDLDLFQGFTQRGDGLLEQLLPALGSSSCRIADVSIRVEVVRQPTE